MKKFCFIAVLTALFLSLSVSLRAEGKTFVYAKIHFESAGGMLSDECNMVLDLGCRMKSTIGENYLLNDKGKPMVFNSNVDGLNYMGRDGWELVNVFAAVDDGSSKPTCYFMKKETTGMTPEEVDRFIDHYNIKHKQK